jgi:toxin ParE1/3/4
MAEIRWTEEAVRWLQDIFDYIADDNAEAAQKVVAGIYDQVQILKTFQQIGYRYRNEPNGEIRILVYGHYRIAYLIKHEAVEILGVFHGAMEIGKYLDLYRP